MEILDQDFKKKFNRKFRYIYLLAFVAFIAYMFYSDKKGKEIELNYKFNGVAEKVIYDEKSVPIVTINGQLYNLGAPTWNFNHLISKGDSLEKDSGSFAIKLTMHKNGRVLIFDEKR